MTSDGGPSGSSYIVQKAQQRGVASVELWVADLAGRPIAVSIPVAGLEGVLEDGLTVPAELIGDGGGELVLMPDAHTFAVPPIARAPGAVPAGPGAATVARLICDVHDVSGAPAALCARSALKRQLGRANALGYTFYMGATVDHRWLAAVGEARPADAATGASLARVAAGVLEAVGASVRAFHGERGRDGSHWAFDLDWVDPLTLGDALLTHRRVLRDVARAAGRDVTFMPHPWPGAARNRLDLYVSLVEGGTPSFPDALDPGGLSPAARAFGAWLEAEVPALELVMKSTVNSWTEPHAPKVLASASGRGERRHGARCAAPTARPARTCCWRWCSAPASPRAAVGRRPTPHRRRRWSRRRAAEELAAGARGARPGSHGGARRPRARRARRGDARSRRGRSSATSTADERSSQGSSIPRDHEHEHAPRARARARAGTSHEHEPATRDPRRELRATSSRLKALLGAGGKVGVRPAP
ncbi:MAG: hypothetical protein U1F43_12490 [Myxococcota bacterium]